MNTEDGNKFLKAAIAYANGKSLPTPAASKVQQGLSVTDRLHICQHATAQGHPQVGDSRRNVFVQRLVIHP